MTDAVAVAVAAVAFAAVLPSITLSFPTLVTLVQLAALLVLVLFVPCVLGCNVTTTTPTTTRTTTGEPTSVNFHFTRRCNYTCGFCFHTAKTSYVLPLEEQKRGLSELSKAGMKKINFSGGEPFLENKGQRVGQLVRFCKENLMLESVTIVTNGSLVTEAWFEKYGKWLDILAVSCDSFDFDTNVRIGRQHRHKDHVESLRQVCDWCKVYGVLFKMNTVVNAFNKDEDMSEAIDSLQPITRWKIFKVLPVVGENTGDGGLRDVASFEVSQCEFEEFLDRHRRAGLEQVALFMPSPCPPSLLLVRAAMQTSVRLFDVGGNEPDCALALPQPQPRAHSFFLGRALHPADHGAGGQHKDARLVLDLGRVHALPRLYQWEQTAV